MAKYSAIGTVMTAGTPVRPVSTPTMCKNVFIYNTHATAKLLIKAVDNTGAAAQAAPIATIPPASGYAEPSQDGRNSVDASSYFVDADTSGATFGFTYTQN